MSSNYNYDDMSYKVKFFEPWETQKMLTQPVENESINNNSSEPLPPFTHLQGQPQKNPSKISFETLCNLLLGTPNLDDPSNNPSYLPGPPVPCADLQYFFPNGSSEPPPLSTHPQYSYAPFDNSSYPPGPPPPLAANQQNRQPFQKQPRDISSEVQIFKKVVYHEDWRFCGFDRVTMKNDHKLFLKIRKRVLHCISSEPTENCKRWIERYPSLIKVRLNNNKTLRESAIEKGREELAEYLRIEEAKASLKHN